MGQAKPGLSPRGLTVVSQGTSVNKEKEGDFISARVVYSVAQQRFSNPLVNSLFRHQRHDLDWENPEPCSRGIIAQGNTPPSGKTFGLAFVMAHSSGGQMFGLQRVPGFRLNFGQNSFHLAGWAVGQLRIWAVSVHLLPSPG